MTDNITKRKISTDGQEKIRLSGYKQWLSRAKEIHQSKFDYDYVYKDFKTQKDQNKKIIKMYFKKKVDPVDKNDE